MDLLKLSKIQPPYKKVIPIDKFRKIFYPKRYMEEKLNNSLEITGQNANSIIENINSINYDLLIEKDLYGQKEKRVNSIYNNPIKRHNQNSNFYVPALLEEQLKFPMLITKKNQQQINNYYTSNGNHNNV